MNLKQLNEINRTNINEIIESYVLLADVKVRTTKTDKRYADLTIQDASKIMEAKLWEYEEMENFLKEVKSQDILYIKVIVGEYQGQLQLTVKHLERSTNENIQLKDLIPTSKWELKTMEEGLRFFYKKIENPKFRELLDKLIFSQTYYSKFSTYPAARRVHHNYYHGILQHTLEVLKFAYTVATTKKLSQRQIDRLIVMTMLHDWAKIMEYKELPELGFTEEGTMLGHIFLGAHETLNQICEIEDFPHEDMLIIINGILGHHGKIEYGSPVMPKTVEAQILHQADKMSGDIESILSFIGEENGEIVTEKLWNMGTDYYKKAMA